MYENPKLVLKKVYQYLELEEVYPTDLSPKNQRVYEGLTPAEYSKYAPFFEKDQANLAKLLGDHFSWNNPPKL